MPVVINEFEVVAEPAQAGQSSEAPAPSAPPAPSAHEIVSMVQRQLERLARVWAH